MVEETVVVVTEVVVMVASKSYQAHYQAEVVCH